MKVHSKFICQQCGYESTGWMGKCPSCGEWNTLVETITQESGSQKGNREVRNVKSIPLHSVTSKKTSRTSTQIPELDRVLGGGIVPGQVILLAGEPGIGKSTILLELADKLGNVVYASGEESVHQIKIRADRLGVKSKKIEVLEETNIDSIINAIDDPSLLIVDSIQTMNTSDLTGLAGSVGQVRECAFRLVRLAKSRNIPVFIVGHVTKEGTVAGPSVLAHIVDTVLWFEGDKTLTLRLLRAYKNRFGPTDEVGIFTMVDKGLVSVSDVSKLFLSDGKPVPGSSVACLMEGTRPILVEIQSLVTPTKMAFAKRVSQGFDTKRLEMLLAVLQKRANIPLYEFDVFVNVVGGVSVKDPGADLAVCMSLASTYFDKSLPKLVAVGEVGLLGEVRDAPLQEKRAKEARRLGYSNIASNKEGKYLSQIIKSYLK